MCECRCSDLESPRKGRECIGRLLTHICQQVLVALSSAAGSRPRDAACWLCASAYHKRARASLSKLSESRARDTASGLGRIQAGSVRLVGRVQQ